MRDIFPSMKTLGERIRSIREAKGLTQNDLALRCGWDTAGQGRIGNYEKDRREPNLSDLRRIADALNVSLLDLVDDQGSGVSEEPATYITDDFVIIDQHTAEGSAGNGHMNDHVEVNGGLAFKRSWLRRKGLTPSSLCVLYVRGDSMETTISDGDVVLIDTNQKEPHDNWIYVLRQERDLLIKRLTRSVTGKWLIRSDNSDKRRFPDFDLTEHDLQNLTIVGRVVWHAGML